MNNVPAIPQIDSIPEIYRVTSTSCVPMKNGQGVTYQIGLYHDDAQLRVQYNLPRPDNRLKVDMLVSVCWKHPPFAKGDAIQISRLVLLDQPVKGCNIFDSVPPWWVKDRELVASLRETLESLPYNLQQLVTSVLWDGVRFRKFCEHPASLSGQHAERNGNLRHTMKVAEAVKKLFPEHSHTSLGLALAAAILHNVGKAAEFRAHGRHDWILSDRGKLVSHRHTAIEWIVEAMATNRIALPETNYLSLIHALTAAHYTEWLGIIAPLTPEAALLASAKQSVKHGSNSIGSPLNQHGEAMNVA